MLDEVREYYGRTLRSNADLQTSACCDQASPDWLKPILAQLHEEVVSRYYGCGLVAPELLRGARVLDLGCGSGRDAYVLSSLVGESGEVLGIDMTPEQLAVAERHRDYHRRQFGHRASNVHFRQGFIEQLDALQLPDDHFDVVVSNCVLNLSEDKQRILREVWRVLRPGGEMYFSDVYADRRIPEELTRDPVLRGECLSGALYWNDFLTLCRAVGFLDPRLVEHRPMSIDNPAIAERLAPARFYSATYRLFKLEGLEPACEDYGQAVVYRGTIEHSEAATRLDAHHVIERGREFPVCGNTWRMLRESRFAPHFEFIGDGTRHFGIFPGCGTPMPFTATGAGPTSVGEGSCC